MKATLDSPARLAAAVTFAGHGVPTAKNPTHPVLAGVKISAAKNDSVTLSGFDFDVSAAATVSADVGEPGQALISYRALADVTRKLPEGKPVMFELEGTRVRIRCGAANFALLTMPLTEYPALPELPDPCVSVAAADLARVLRQTAGAAAHNNAKAELNCLQLEFGPDTMTGLATDRFRIAWAEAPYTPIGMTRPHLLIPAERLTGYLKGIPEDEGLQVTVSVDPDRDEMGLAAFSWEGRSITTRLMQGKIPLPPGVMEMTASPDVATMLAEHILDAVDRAKVVMPEPEKGVVLHFTEGMCEVSGHDEQTGGMEASDAFPVTYEGPAVTRTMNPAFLAYAVEGCMDEVVKVEFIDSAVIRVTANRKGPVTYSHMVQGIGKPGSR
jgi:DNA polymerase III subunit beta